MSSRETKIHFCATCCATCDDTFTGRSMNFSRVARHPPRCIVANFMARDYLINSCFTCINWVKILNILFKSECG